MTGGQRNEIRKDSHQTAEKIDIRGNNEGSFLPTENVQSPVSCILVWNSSKYFRGFACAWDSKRRVEFPPASEVRTPLEPIVEKFEHNSGDSMGSI